LCDNATSTADADLPGRIADPGGAAVSAASSTAADGVSGWNLGAGRDSVSSSAAAAAANGSAAARTVWRTGLSVQGPALLRRPLILPPQSRPLDWPSGRKPDGQAAAAGT
jgi:hypothetical protein